MDVKKILVAVDFSPESHEALGLARVLADALGASMHLMTVVPSPFNAPGDLEQERRDARDRLEGLLDREDRTVRRASVSCEAGTPAHEIARYAADRGIDLIVMGTHSHGPAYRMAAGSIAETVLGAAPCAVLAVKRPGAAVPTDNFDTAVARVAL